MKRIWLYAVLGSMGCDDGGDAVAEDAAAVVDGSIMVDAARSSDAASRPDMAPRPDMDVAPDASPPDMATPPGDMAPPPVDGGLEADAAPTADASPPDMAPPPADAGMAAGACANPADRAALDAAAATISDTIGGCVFECFGRPSTCAAACIATAVGLTEACGVCFGDIVQCTVDNCALDCIDPNGGACTDCQERACTPAFETCSGVERP